MKNYLKQLNALPMNVRIMMFAGFGVVFLAIGYVISMTVVNGFATSSDRSEGKAVRMGAILALLLLFAAGSALKKRLTDGKSRSGRAGS